MSIAENTNLAKLKEVQCRNGDRLTAGGGDEHGVTTRRGIVAWSEIEGWWVWSNLLERKVFVPV